MYFKRNTLKTINSIQLIVSSLIYELIILYIYNMNGYFYYLKSSLVLHFSALVLSYHIF